MRKFVLASLAVAAALALAVAAVASRGVHDTYDRGHGPSPPWAAPCYAGPPRPDRKLLHFCARVRGRVLHVWRQSNEAHLAVLAHWHVLIVKLDRPQAPGVGSTISAVGPMVQTKHDLEEVQAFRATWAGKRP